VTKVNFQQVKSVHENMRYKCILNCPDVSFYAVVTPGERGVVGLEAQQTASREVAVLLVVDDRSALQQELVDVRLQ